MKNIEDEDKILKDKIEESTFDYNEAYWEKAKQMLATGKKRRVILWWWPASIFLLLVVVSGAYYLLNYNDVVKNKEVVNPPLVQKANKSIGDNKKQIRNESDTNKELIPDNNLSNAGTGSIAANNDLSGRKIESINNEVKAGLFAENHSRLNDISAKSKIKSDSHNKNKGQVLFPEPEIKFEESQPGNENVSATGIVSLVESDETMSNNLASNSEAKKQGEMSVMDSLKGRSIYNVANTESPLKDNAVDSVFKKGLPKIAFMRKQFININAGVDVNKAIEVTGSKKFAIGAMPYAGISYTRAIDKTNKKLIEIGLQVSSFSNVQSEDVIHHSNYYSFGYGRPDVVSTAKPQPVTDTTFTLKQKSLFVIQLPVSLNYSINGKSSFNVGVGLSYTFNVLSDVTNFNGSEKQMFGYTKGFTPFNAFVQVGYSYHFTPRWLLHLNIEQGVTNMIDNSFLNTGRKYFSTNAQLGLSYQFAIHSKGIFYAKK